MSSGRMENRRTKPPFLNYFLSSETTKPIGFVPRRKHQKSRRGCTTCKKRHIRCDEAWPRCQNCTKHQSTCHYPEAHHEAPSGNTTLSEDAASIMQEHTSSGTSPLDDKVQTWKAIGSVSEDPTNGPSSMEMNPRSLDPYSCSVTPMTVARREHLAFCKLIPDFRFISTFPFRRNTRALFLVFYSPIELRPDQARCIMANDQFFLCRHRRGYRPGYTDIRHSQCLDPDDRPLSVA